MRRITDGIYLIDTNYLGIKEYAASYIIVDNGIATIIETNTNKAVPKILNSLNELNIKKEQVKYIILTHIHLDHAGGVGLLMQSLKNAELIVHGRGKRHLINPEKLIESVKAVYGEDEYRRMYGDILPVDEKRIRVVENKTNLKSGNRDLFIFESSGHAKHHISVFDKKAGTLFSGDSFGIGYPCFKFDDELLVFPSTSPTQFEPEEALDTINKSIALNPEKICLTHFGELSNIKSATNQLKEWIEFLTLKAENLHKSGLTKNKLSDELEKLIFEKFNSTVKKYRGKELSKKEIEKLRIDFELNAKGVSHYIEKNKSLKKN